MSWSRVDRPVKRGRKWKKCYKRQRTILKNKATRQKERNEMKEEGREEGNVRNVIIDNGQS